MRTLLSIAVLAIVATPVSAQRRRPPPAPGGPETAVPAPPPVAPAVAPAATPSTGGNQPAAVTGGTPATSAPDAEPGPVAPGDPLAPDDSAPPAPPDAATQDKADLAALQQELAQVMDDLVQARARVAVLGKSLFKTRVRVKLDNRAGDDAVAAKVALWLDGAPIFSGDGSAVRDPERTLWDGFAAPGPHVLTFEVEQRARDDEAYRYTLRESYRFMVARERRTDIRLVLEDDSDMAEDFPDDQEGSYEAQTRVEVRAVALNDE